MADWFVGPSLKGQEEVEFIWMESTLLSISCQTINMGIMFLRRCTKTCPWIYKWKVFWVTGRRGQPHLELTCWSNFLSGDRLEFTHWNWTGTGFSINQNYFTNISEQQQQHADGEFRQTSWFFNWRIHRFQRRVNVDLHFTVLVLFSRIFSWTQARLYNTKSLQKQSVNHVTLNLVETGLSAGGTSRN